MNTSTHNQSFYTKLFLSEQFGDLDIPESAIEHFRKLWWKNPYKTKSLKLSKAGYVFLKTNLKLVEYEIDLESDMLSFKDTNLYDNGLNGPWYLRGKKLITFDSKDATMINLYGVDNHKQTLERKNNKY